MEDRYTAQLAARVSRDLRTRENYLLAVPLMAPSFTLNVTVLAALATGLGTIAVSGTGFPSWAAAGAGVVFGLSAGVAATRWRMRTATSRLPGRPSTMFALAVTDRRFLLYRRTLGNRARELLIALPRNDVRSVAVERGTFLRPRPVTLHLRDGTTLQFEGARADSVSRLPSVAGAGGAGE
jgi:hypothetical protein